MSLPSAGHPLRNVGLWALLFCFNSCTQPLLTKQVLLEEEALCSVIYSCSEGRGLKRQPLLIFLGYQRGLGSTGEPGILLRGTKKRSLYLSFGSDLRLWWGQCRHGEGSPAAA